MSHRKLEDVAKKSRQQFDEQAAERHRQNEALVLSLEELGRTSARCDLRFFELAIRAAIEAKNVHHVKIVMREKRVGIDSKARGLLWGIRDVHYDLPGLRCVFGANSTLAEGAYAGELQKLLGNTFKVTYNSSQWETWDEGYRGRIEHADGSRSDVYSSGTLYKTTPHLSVHW